LIAQSAEDANLVLLQRKGNQVVIDNDPVNIRNWRVDQILTSDLFGLESARSPNTAKLLDERTKILSKKQPSGRDEKRLKALESQIGELPVGETPRPRKNGHFRPLTASPSFLRNNRAGRFFSFPPKPTRCRCCG
jgi:hypothetical protein